MEIQRPPDEQVLSLEEPMSWEGWKHIRLELTALRIVQGLRSIKLLSVLRNSKSCAAVVARALEARAEREANKPQR